MQLLLISAVPCFEIAASATASSSKKTTTAHRAADDVAYNSFCTAPASPASTHSQSHRKRSAEPLRCSARSPAWRQSEGFQFAPTSATAACRRATDRPPAADLWKSKFGRPTPSTRRCLSSRVCSRAWSFQAIDATLSP